MKNGSNVIISKCSTIYNTNLVQINTKQMSMYHLTIEKSVNNDGQQSKQL